MGGARGKGWSGSTRGLQRVTHWHTHLITCELVEVARLETVPAQQPTHFRLWSLVLRSHRVAVVEVPQHTVLTTNRSLERIKGRHIELANIERDERRVRQHLTDQTQHELVHLRRDIGAREDEDGQPFCRRAEYHLPLVWHASI